MSTTITGKLTKSANQFAAGDSTGFGIRLGVQYYDRETQQKEWTNYEAVIFARNQNQIAFLQQALVEGSIVEVTGKQQKIKQFQGNNGLSLSIELVDASVGYIGTAQASGVPNYNQAPQQPQQAPQQPQQQGGFQQQAPAPQQQVAQPQGSGFEDFEDKIPF